MHNPFNACSNYKTFKLQRTRIQNKQFAVDIFDTLVTLKQSQGPQAYSDNVDLDQGYNHAMFDRSCFYGVREKANIQVFSNQEICQLSPFNRSENQKQWYIPDLFEVMKNQTTFQFNWLGT